MPTTTSVTSVERAMRILEILDASRSGLSVSAISRKLDSPKSSVYVIILTLEHMGYLVRQADHRHYTLSLKVYSLGREMMQNMAIHEMALEPMKWLVAKTGLTAHLAVLEKNQAIYVQKVDGPAFIRFDTFIGKRTNLHCTAVGKVLLAYSPPLLRDQFLSKTAFARYTPKTITSAALLRKSLDKVRELRYALDDEEEELEIRCIAAPVFLETEFVAALSVTGTVGQIPSSGVGSLVSLVKRCAALIGQRPGAARPTRGLKLCSPEKRSRPPLAG